MDTLPDAPRRLFAGVVFACLFSILSLSGCTALLDTASSRRAEDSVASTSYAAADMLMQQSRSFVSQQTPLEIGVLLDMDNPNEQTNFGQMIARQIGSRFVQLGYDVTADSEMTSGTAPDGTGWTPAMIAPAAGSNTSNQAMLTGRYAIARDSVLVNLRIMDIASGKVLAAYDYTIPKTRNVAELVKTKADKESFFDF